MGKNIVRKRRGVFVHTYKDDHHAELAPSGSGRWLMCAGSHQLKKKLLKRKLIKEDKPGRAAATGTLAHWINEQCPDYPTTKPEKFLGQEHEVDGFRIQVDHEMNAGCLDFLEYVEDIKFFEDVKHDETEQWVDLEFLDIDGLEGGTVDRNIYTKDHHLYVVDFKYGKIPVDPYTSTQIRIYAVALLERYPKCKRVTLAIVQPRGRSGPKIKEYEVTANYIREWREEVLVPRANAVWTDPGSFVISEKGCEYCPSINYCPAQEQIIMLAQAPREWLTSSEKLKLWHARKTIVKTLNEVESQLTYDVVNGKHKNDLKVVAKNTQRRPITANVIKFFGKDAYKEPQLKGVGELEKLLKQTETTPRYPLFEKPEGEPELAAIDDNRQPLAKIEFNDYKD